MDAMNQHKRMAGAGGSSDGFPVRAEAHPDRGMDTGRPMGEGERAVGEGVRYSKDHMPAQQAPDHGPHHHKNWNRGGKV